MLKGNQVTDDDKAAAD